MKWPQRRCLHIRVLQRFYVVYHLISICLSKLPAIFAVTVQLASKEFNYDFVATRAECI